MEVEEGRDASSLGQVALGFSIADALESAVEAVYVRLVVLGVVKLHDLTRDVRLERAVVVWTRGVRVRLGYSDRPSHVSRALNRASEVCTILRDLRAKRTGSHPQERSGSVALPRTNWVVAMPITGFAAPARRAPRSAGVDRRRVDDIVGMEINFCKKFSQLKSRV